jgi:hypothetical protein
MAPANAAASPPGQEVFEGDEIDEGEAESVETSDIVTTGTEAIDQTSGSFGAVPGAESAPERVTPQLTTTDPAAREEAAPDVPNKAEGES